MAHQDQNDGYGDRRDNRRNSNRGYRNDARSYRDDRPRDEIIASRKLDLGDRKFFLDFRKNERGSYLRITEERHGKRNSVMMDDAQVLEFFDSLEGLLFDTRHLVET